MGNSSELVLAAGFGAVLALVLERWTRREKKCETRLCESNSACGRGVSSCRRFHWDDLEKLAISVFEFGGSAGDSHLPLVISDAPLGIGIGNQAQQYIETALGDTKVQAHVSEVAELDFVSKNFKYEIMSMREFLAKASLHYEDQLFYYYRSQGKKRNQPSKLEDLGFEENFFRLPSRLLDGFEVHSSVLRVASPGVKVWLHYDVCDNYLCCLQGRKRVLLFHPCEVSNLYVDTSSSRTGSRLLETDSKLLQHLWAEFPLAEEAWSRRTEVILEQGDVLFIPAMWLHSTVALPAGNGNKGLCVSANIFLVNPERKYLHDPKDVWANRELLPAQDAIKLLDSKVFPSLSQLPPVARSFYSRKISAALMEVASSADAELRVAA